MDVWARFDGSPQRDWALEIYKNGDRAKGHWDRFQPGGAYASMPFDDYLLIDFREAGKIGRAKRLRDKVLYVNINASHSSAIVQEVSNPAGFELKFLEQDPL